MPQWVIALVSSLLAAVGGMAFYLLTVIVSEAKQASDERENMRAALLLHGERLNRLDATRHVHANDLTPVFPPEYRPP